MKLVLEYFTGGEFERIYNICTFEYSSKAAVYDCIRQKIKNFFELKKLNSKEHEIWSDGRTNTETKKSLILKLKEESNKFEKLHIFDDDYITAYDLINLYYDEDNKQLIQEPELCLSILDEELYIKVYTPEEFFTAHFKEQEL